MPPDMTLLVRMLLVGLVLTTLTSTTDSFDLPEVVRLRAQPGFHEVRLRWEVAHTGVDFLVLCCELQQPRSSHRRCDTKTVPSALGRPAVTEDGRPVQVFSVVMSGLRMATNYTLEVRPQDPAGKEHGSFIAVATRGFSARATLCLPEWTEVEVVTGPHFGGRVSSESGPCWVDGDPRSARDVYLLRVEHATCASQRNSSAAASYVTVQESSALLTHSTRRFLVVCAFQPDTLTVTAGIRLPSAGEDNELEAEGLEAVEAAEAAVSEVPVPRLLQRDRPLVNEAGHHQEPPPSPPLSSLLVASCGLFGCAVLLVWWLVPGKITGTDPELWSSASSCLENAENTMRDRLTPEREGIVNVISLGPQSHSDA